MDWFNPVNLIVGILAWLTTGSHADPNANSGTLEHYKYRIVNWCVVGNSELELFEWPLVQFKPFLLKTHKFQTEKDTIEKLDPALYEDKDITIPDPPPVPGKSIKDGDLEFKGIECDKEPAVGKTTSKPVYLNRVHIKLKLKDKVEGLLIQGNHAPFNLGFPFGQFDVTDEFQCSCDNLFAESVPCLTRPDMELIPPTVAVFHYQLRKFLPSIEANAKKEKYPKVLKEIGEQKEFHFNFKWHSTPCSSAKNVQFLVLVVHSFFERRYEILRYGPYDFTEKIPTMPLPTAAPHIFTTTKGLIANPTFIPSPILGECRTYQKLPEMNCTPTATPKVACDEVFNVECHTSNYFASSNYLKKDQTSIRLNGEFDSTCISKYSLNEPGKQCINWTGIVGCKELRYADLSRLDTPGDNKKEDKHFKKTFCQACKYDGSTTEPPDENKANKFIKTSWHGGCMTLSLLYFLPVSILIGRFFKETFHDCAFKGWRLWLWMHFGVGIFAMLLSYTAYNIPAFWELDSHMWWGYAALFSALLGLITGWGRHKDCLNVTFWTHSLFGYLAWICAVISFWYSRASFNARIAGVASVGFFCLAMLALTCLICSSDKSVGMKPSRFHIPILQIRFENLYPPDHLIRKIAFFVIIIIYFVLVIMTFFF